MSNNPTATLGRPRIDFCLARRKRRDLEHELTCTRINDHPAHCCDEIAEQAWTDDGRVAKCADNYDHSKEKGLSS